MYGKFLYYQIFESTLRYEKLSIHRLRKIKHTLNCITKSGEFWRRSFVVNNCINLEKDLFTVKEFIDLTIDSYNGMNIKILKERIGL